ncbi:MAG: 4-hydroxythreonine-4-phosphate dehydrogenase PdxA [Planctomycetes bacterium]|nr:4-hydroxythreonine-4-phosphate dehydrogenase PdxA [Planctomycetota bacterium]MCA8936796.1 4-hydroxythreonine-4-phosphate dehydrogenase PdxA [Planctomycetota bacterium]
MSSHEDSGEYEAIEVPAPILVTAGDPAGIGAEVAHKAIKKLQRRKEILPERPIVVVGDAYLYSQHLEKPSAMHTYNIVPVDDFLEDAGYLFDHLMPRQDKPWRPIFLDCGFKDESAIKPGEASDLAGERAATYLSCAIELLVEEMADAVCTAPICKEHMPKEAFPFPGQTEFFADACDERHPVMMLVGGGLRVSLVTIHEPLVKVARMLNRKDIVATIEITARALREDFGITEPRIAVCGFNPHAGENGKFGKEEIKIIEPAVKLAKKRGIDVTGPWPGDTVFHHAKEGRYDAVVAMYHDQGLIPVKTLAFYEGVNVTLGLPIVRTSPDHGTGFDIAGKNQANEDAMLNALRMADEHSCRREQQFART